MSLHIGREVAALKKLTTADLKERYESVCDCRPRSHNRDWLIKKIINLRIFKDDQEKMNLSVQDVDGGILVVSQFTLFANSKKGNRPSYIHAAQPEHATALYEQFSELLRQEGLEVANGVFGANMDVELINQGPVTIWLDTDEL